jgi:hypothetical protein
MRAHRCSLHALAVALQIALSATFALAASALAVAAHHQSPKCAALLFPKSACMRLWTKDICRALGCELETLAKSLAASSRDIAAVLVVMLALVRPSLWRGLTFYLPRPALRASSALHKVRGGMPLAAAGFGLGLRAEDSHPYSMRVL